tara:strand:- start:232 stop:825 length:594 start_codon:yes stop_codon:yes gene_type:complete
MPDYNKAQIYKITSPNTSKVYYGSTVKTLAQRFAHHKCTTGCSSREIINAGGADIKHIEWFPCDNKHALEDREAYFILNNWDGCVNRAVPGAVRRAGGAKAYEQSPEKKAYKRARALTPEVKARRQTPEAKAKAKAYYQTPDVQAHRKTPIQCACGKWSTFGHIKRHQRSNTCIKIIESQVAATMNDMLDQLCVIES